MGGGEGFGWASLLPLAAGAIAAVFAVVLGRRAVARRSPSAAAWTVALVMYALASFAMVYGVTTGWSPWEFRLYWLLGAVLNVPFLFLGEVYLLSPRRVWGHALLAVLVAASVYAALEVWRAQIDEAALRHVLPLGREVFGDGTAPHRLAQVYSWPAYLLLLAGLVWSTWQMRGRRDLRHRTTGVLALALGATLVAVGSGVGAGFRLVPVFAVGLAAGVAVMFWGFLKATRPAPAGERG